MSSVQQPVTFGVAVEPERIVSTHEFTLTGRRWQAGSRRKRTNRLGRTTHRGDTVVLPSVFKLSPTSSWFLTFLKGLNWLFEPPGLPFSGMNWLRCAFT